MITRQGNPLLALRVVPHHPDLIALEDRGRDARRQIIDQRGRRRKPMTQVERIETATTTDHERGEKGLMSRCQVRLRGQQRHLGLADIGSQTQQLRGNTRLNRELHLVHLVERNPSDLEREGTHHRRDRPLSLSDLLLILQQHTLQAQQARLELVDRQLIHLALLLQLVSQLVRGTGLLDRAIQDRPLLIQTDQLEIERREIGDQDRPSQVRRLDRGHPTGRRRMFLLRQLTPDIGLPLETDSQSQILVGIRNMLIGRQVGRVGRTVTHAIHRVLAKTLDTGLNSDRNLRQ